MKEINSINDAPWTNLIEDHGKYRIYLDGFPVAEGHRLYVPIEKRDHHVMARCFEAAWLYGEERVRRGEWGGYNIGMNCGAVAGQTVDWPHLHLIPRRSGDTEDPIGGVRHVIRGQGNYHNDNYHDPRS